MNRRYWVFGAIILIILGASFIIFTMQMIWIPPNHQNMMNDMMNGMNLTGGINVQSYHLFSWFVGTLFIIFLVVAFSAMIKWLTSEKDKERKK